MELLLLVSHNLSLVLIQQIVQKTNFQLVWIFLAREYATKMRLALTWKNSREAFTSELEF